MIAVFTRWVKQKVKCKVNDKGEVLEIIDIIEDEIDEDNYELV